MATSLVEVLVLSGSAVTAFPFGAVAVAVAVLSTVPPSTSAWVIV